MFETPDQMKRHSPDSSGGGLGKQEENENKLFLDNFNEYNKLKEERLSFENTWGERETDKSREEYHEKVKEFFLKEDNALNKLLEFFYKTQTIDLAYSHIEDDGTLSSWDDSRSESDVDDIKVIPEGIFRRIGGQLGDLDISKIDSIKAEELFQRSSENKKFCLEALNLRLKTIEESKEKLNKELKLIEELREKL